jgi:hypothetical protein
MFNSLQIHILFETLKQGKSTFGSNQFKLI